MYQDRIFFRTSFSFRRKKIFQPFSWKHSQRIMGRVARAQAPPMDEFQAMDRMEIKVQLQSNMGKFFRIFFENTIRIKGSAKAQRT